MKTDHISISVLLGSVIIWVGIFLSSLYMPLLTSLFGERKSITVFTWPETLDPHHVAEFEKQTGITVYVTYYEDNEEMFGKLMRTEGVGYDIVAPTDYVVPELIKRGLIKKLDRTKLDFLDDLNPQILGHYFDPHNEYTTPSLWGVYGVAINKNLFGQEMPRPSWDLIFNPDKAPGRVTMTGAPREALMIAAKYLFNSIDALADPEKRKQVTQLLIEQKKNVLLYSETRTDELLFSQSSPALVALSPDVWKASREDDDDMIAFLIPQEGSFMFIDSYALCAASEKDELVYQFLNYLYQKEIVEHHANSFGSCPIRKDVTLQGSSAFCPSEEILRTLDFFRPVLTEKEVDQVWMDVMAA